MAGNQMEIPGCVTFMDGNGELPKIEINTAWSDAEIYLQGAHITHFKKKEEAPVLFMSQFSRFQTGAPIRGGIPVIFPWFGSREGQPQHGFVRTKMWDLKQIVQSTTGEVSLKFSLPECAENSLLPKFTAEYVVTVGKALTCELIIINTSSDQDFTLENCLHTYFTVGDINAVSVSGLKGATYLDKVENFSRKREASEHIKIVSETDRVYLDTSGTVEIHDSKLGRRIVIEKSGSTSTVLWNPWVAKSQQMPDFGNEEFHHMVCVESGNVAENKVTLPAGKSTSLKVSLSTAPL
jgi:glucose-6-phosphate 1-epimerase